MYSIREQLYYILDKIGYNSLAKASTVLEDGSTTFCDLFKQYIIKNIATYGLTYDATIDNSSQHKFIAWSLENSEQSSLNNALENLHYCIYNYIKNDLGDFDLNKLSFNIRNCECLIDKETKTRLFRTLINIRSSEQ